MTQPLAEPPAEADQGLQAERTYLAWQRTGLTFAGVGALLVHAGHTRPALYGAGALGLAVAAAILLRGLLRYRTTLAAARGEVAATAAWAIVAVAVAASVLAVSGLVVVLLGT